MFVRGRIEKLRAAQVRAESDILKQAEAVRLHEHSVACNTDSSAINAASEFLKVKEIAAVMRVSDSVVIRLIKQGRLAAINVSGGRRPTYRIPRESFEQFRKTTMLVPPRIVPHYKPKLPPWIHQFV